MIEMAQGTLPGFISALRAAANGGCAPKRACGRSRTHPSFPSKESPPLFDKLTRSLLTPCILYFYHFLKCAVICVRRLIHPSRPGGEELAFRAELEINMNMGGVLHGDVVQQLLQGLPVQVEDAAGLREV